MPKLILINTLVILLLFTSKYSHSGDIIADSLKDIGVINKEAAAALDKAHDNLKKATRSYKSLEESGNKEVRDAFKALGTNNRFIVKKAFSNARFESEQNVNRVTESVKVAESKLVEINSKIKELGEISLQIEEDRDNLKVEKADVERKADLLSVGFYASLTTTMIAIFGFLINLPTIRLERELKRLQIEEKKLIISHGGTAAI